MKWTIPQWIALIWLLAIFVGTMGAPFVASGILRNIWFILIQVFVIASLLGIWLTAGMGPFWLRLLGMLVMQILLFWGVAIVFDQIHIGINVGLTATTAFTTVSMFGLGCLGSLLPIRLTWNARISLWEIVVSVGLIGVTLAAVRFLFEIYQWNWAAWASLAGLQYLVFALFTGLLMTLVLLPLIINGRGPRLFAIFLLLLGILVIPPIEFWTFDQLEPDADDLSLFYAVHTGQTILALALMIPLVVPFPGVLVRQTPPEVPPAAPLDEKQNHPGTQEDFAEMQ